MKKFAHSKYGKGLLILIGFSIAIALVTSIACSGPIDVVFAGWRDMTFCETNNSFTCFIPGESDQYRGSGVVVLVMLLLLSALLYGIYKLVHKLIVKYMSTWGQRTIKSNILIYLF